MSDGAQRGASYSAPDLIASALGLALLHVILVLPDRTWLLAPAAFARLPVELPLAVLALALAPARLRVAVRRIVVAVAGVVLALKLADMVGFMATGRPFDPLTDWRTFGPAWKFAAGSWGSLTVGVALAAAVLAVAAVLAALDRALAGLGRLLSSWRPPAGRLFAGAPALALAAAALAAPDPAPGLRLVADHVALAARNARDLSRLVASAADDPVASIAASELFARIAGSDVLLVFVESYGRSAVEDPRYAPTVRARLGAFEATLADRGLSARSGWLTAPVVGGQSWLAHATLLSGLWIDRQQRYDWLVASDREALNAMFSRAGWRSVAVMPAITMDWPESAYYGYDAVYAADDLGYRGRPFNWVTMPDQFTLAAMRRAELAAADRPPVMAEIALISSHAPWTPIPPVLAWDEIGDGEVFDVHAEAGDPPSVVWRDADRVRDQYRQAVDYALATLVAYVEAYGGDDTILIVLGDHQPASIVTGPDASRDVPVHVIAAPDSPALEAVVDWGWSSGMLPGEDVESRRMDAFRERFVAATSGDGR